jgi:ketosteroid isomerase-like protein
MQWVGRGLCGEAFTVVRESVAATVRTPLRQRVARWIRTNQGGSFVIDSQSMEGGLVTDQSLQVVKGTYEAFARGDVPGVLGAMADDVEWYEAEGMPYGGLHRGGDAVAQRVFGPLIADIPDFAVTPEEFIPSGDTVAVVARYTGSGKETGKRLDLPVVHVWDVRDGKIVRFRQFADTAKFLEVVPARVATTA